MSQDRRLTLRDRLFRFLVPSLARNWEERTNALREELASIRSERDYFRDEVEFWRNRESQVRDAHHDDLRKTNDWLCWQSGKSAMFSGEVDPQRRLLADRAEEKVRARRSARDEIKRRERDFWRDNVPVPERPLPTQTLRPPPERPVRPEPTPTPPTPAPPPEPNGRGETAPLTESADG